MSNSELKVVSETSGSNWELHVQTGTTGMLGKIIDPNQTIKYLGRGFELYYLLILLLSTISIIINIMTERKVVNDVFTKRAYAVFIQGPRIKPTSYIVKQMKH